MVRLTTRLRAVSANRTRGAATVERDAACDDQAGDWVNGGLRDQIELPKIEDPTGSPPLPPHSGTDFRETDPDMERDSRLWLGWPVGLR